MSDKPESLHFELSTELVSKEFASKQDDYNKSVAYAIDQYPLSDLPGYYTDGCSSVVEAGYPLGRGRFCDYFILAAGSTIVVFYNRFQPAT